MSISIAMACSTLGSRLQHYCSLLRYTCECSISQPTLLLLSVSIESTVHAFLLKTRPFRFINSTPDFMNRDCVTDSTWSAQDKRAQYCLNLPNAITVLPYHPSYIDFRFHYPRATRYRVESSSTEVGSKRSLRPTDDISFSFLLASLKGPLSVRGVQEQYPFWVQHAECNHGS